MPALGRLGLFSVAMCLCALAHPNANAPMFDEFGNRAMKPCAKPHRLKLFAAVEPAMKIFLTGDS